MRISTVVIRNYRSLKHVKFEVDNYGAFIGANGAGKSSVLYALDWFFNGTPLTDLDIHGHNPGDSIDPTATIEVAVSFTELSPRDRIRLQQYGRGERAEIRRTWYALNKQTKTVGNARQGPGFAEVRADQGVAARRKGYKDLCENVTDLTDLGNAPSKDDILTALDLWESDSKNAQDLVEVADNDATQMMGWNGPNILRECVRFVLIPAATSIAGEVGTSARGTALTELVGAFMAAASTSAQATWLEKNAKAVGELTGEIRKSIEGATGIQATRVNARLTALIPNAKVTLTPTVPDFTPKLDPAITTAVTISGITNDVSRQGHGVQRAVMMSMFQAMVPDEDYARSTHETQEGEDESTAQARLNEALSNLPGIIVGIEEPEIYQHPVRARSFARTLLDLSSQTGVQVLLATHSPYFVRPDKFGALHRFTYSRGETVVANATVTSVAVKSGLTQAAIEKHIISKVPTEFSEGFFADAVVLVEGRTDKIVLEAVASKLGYELDSFGVTVLSVDGKDGLRVAYAILTSLDIPTYVLADGDFGTSDRKNYHEDKTDDEVKNLRKQAHASHMKSTNELADSLHASSSAPSNSGPYRFGQASCVTEEFTIWRDDIEEELASWPTLIKFLQGVNVDLKARNNKNTLVYRNGVLAASREDLPAILEKAVKKIVELSVHYAPESEPNSVPIPGQPTG